MLLMQYNDNIPAVFGFPLVIPHQRRRGGTEEEEERRTEGESGALFLATLGCFCPPLSVRLSPLFLPSSCPPCQACCLLHNPGSSLHFSCIYSWIKVCVFYFVLAAWKCQLTFEMWCYQFGASMKQTTAVNVILPQTERQRHQLSAKMCYRANRLHGHIYKHLAAD